MHRWYAIVLMLFLMCFIPTTASALSPAEARGYSACRDQFTLCSKACLSFTGEERATCSRQCRADSEQCTTEVREATKKREHDRRERQQAEQRESKEKAEADNRARNEERRKAEQERQRRTSEEAAAKEATRPKSCEEKSRSCRTECKTAENVPRCNQTCTVDYNQCQADRRLEYVKGGGDAREYLAICKADSHLERFDCQCVVPFINRERERAGPNALSSKVRQAALSSVEVNKTCLNPRWLEYWARHSCHEFMPKPLDVAGAARCDCIVPKTIDLYKSKPNPAQADIQKILWHEAARQCPGPRSRLEQRGLVK